eukprot:UN10672
MLRVVSRTAITSLRRGVATSNNIRINNTTCTTKPFKHTTKYSLQQQQSNRNISTLNPSRLYNAKPIPRTSSTSLQRQYQQQQQQPLRSE